MPLTEREAYNAYMRAYKRKRTLLLQAMRGLFQWLERAEDGQWCKLGIFEGTNEILLENPEGVKMPEQTKQKLGIPTRQPSKQFIITAVVNK